MENLEYFSPAENRANKLPQSLSKLVKKRQHLVVPGPGFTPSLAARDPARGAKQEVLAGGPARIWQTTIIAA